MIKTPVGKNSKLKVESEALFRYALRNDDSFSCE